MSKERSSNKMSCTVMYQPYAMSSYSNCDRPAPEKKSFRFPYVPSPPDSLHSDGSSYSSPGPSSGGTASSVGSSQQPPSNSGGGGAPTRRPLTPSSFSIIGGSGVPGLSSISGGGGSTAPATITSATQLQLQQRSPPSAHLHHPSHLNSSNSNRHPSSNHHHHSHHQSSHSHSLSQSLIAGTGLGTGNASATSTVPSAASSTSTSQSHNNAILDDDDEDLNEGDNSNANATMNGLVSGGGGGGGGGNRAQYLSANCVVYENYRGDAARVVEEHFSRALNGATGYSNDKASKCLPMSTRNFPQSFWNANHQPSKPLVGYGASEFYGAAVDYGPSLSGLSHHHQADPWHYPLTSHQGYHHRPTDLSYPPMPSTSRFNAAQYGSFLLAGAAATSSASRFTGMPSTQCGVKGDTPPAWPTGRYHHPHDSLSELHLADYSAAAAAHYSSMTAGLETTVGQESSSKDLYWF